jgi:hypothetical protein
MFLKCYYLECSAFVYLNSSVIRSIQLTYDQQNPPMVAGATVHSVDGGLAYTKDVMGLVALLQLEGFPAREPWAKS